MTAPPAANTPLAVSAFQLWIGAQGWSRSGAWWAPIAYVSLTPCGSTVSRGGCCGARPGSRCPSVSYFQGRWPLVNCPRAATYSGSGGRSKDALITDNVSAQTNGIDATAERLLW